ncbi:palmitoyl-acyl carrier protein thioesterase, chloroplastic-like isoform X2 [Juglans microcarpa x Juglans regia]|uniref:palmitoyl-acyl carrier protein thioesterase, chloroplastic-like isoform X2 n=1 Tax=Juglans microcarpa x Juglans regia TaxID=2249226 RepID=UPI001B7EF414|nr:palmitoyl-acyl carrier protein thioesterase, chloroplastic-like isoform X2 [Juglans microcarpa x Juglans regia]
MVATAATSAFFPAASPAPDSGPKTAKKLANLGGMKSKSAGSSGALQGKASAQASPKINGTSVGLKKPVEGVKNEFETSSPAPRTFINTLPDWSMLLAAITTIFLAAEKQWMMLDWKPRRPDMLIDPFGLGRIVQDGLVFRQNFSIRSYEIGADRTASIETLMNHLQETALNHVKGAGLLGDGFGSTPEMCKKNLIWVVTRMQVVVDRYPTWDINFLGTLVCLVSLIYYHRGDVVQVDTWVSPSGKNGMRRDWVLLDSKTGKTLTRASSVWVMMNKQTRRLSKIPEEVRGEIEPYFTDTVPVVEEDSRKLQKLDDNTADYVRTGLSPRWSDLDVNLHVNNVKYIGWILEGAPLPILESYELSAMTLEYRRECGKDNVLQSLTAVSGSGVGNLGTLADMECQHLLRLENGAEIVRGRTSWRPKHASNFGTFGPIPAESIEY